MGARRRGLHLAKRHHVFVELLEPSAVYFSASGKAMVPDLGGALVKIPGTWYVAEGPPTRAWVTRLLLDPRVLEAASGRRTDVEVRVFEFERLHKSGAGFFTLEAPLVVEGVISVIPDIGAARVTVVGRRGGVSWDAVTRAFSATKARLKGDAGAPR